MSMATHSERPVVGLYAGAATQPERAFRKWEGTIYHLQHQGADVVLLNAGVTFHDTRQAERGVRLGRTAPDSTETVNQHIEAIRDYTGRLALAGMPVLNSPEARALLQDKKRFYADFASVTAKTLAVQRDTADSDIDSFLAELRGEHAVLKPVKGHAGSGVERVLKTDISGRLHEVFSANSDASYLVQQALDTQYMPGTLKPRTEGDKAALAGVAAQELRFFSSNEIMTPVLRVDYGPIQGPDSPYVYIDPESVPEAAYGIGRRVIRQALEQSGSAEIFCALDLVYQRETMSWSVMEVNVKEPAMPSRQDGGGIGNIVHQQLAAQLYRMAMPPNETQ